MALLYQMARVSLYNNYTGKNLQKVVHKLFFFLIKFWCSNNTYIHTILHFSLVNDTVLFNMLQFFLIVY